MFTVTMLKFYFFIKYNISTWGDLVIKPKQQTKMWGSDEIQLEVAMNNFSW